VLTLVNLTTWQNVGTLTLRDPVTQAPVALVSPSSASSKVLYAVGGNAKANTGYLFSIVLDPATKRMKIRSTFAFVGKSGASPVVVNPTVSGLANNLVLLHVPGLASDVQPQDRLLGLSDTGGTFTTLWSVDLPQALAVTPTIDESTGTLFYVFDSDYRVYQLGYLTGQAVNTFDIRLLGGFPVNFSINSHIGGIQAGTSFTMLLAGAVSTTPGNNGEYVMAFSPNSASPAVLWKYRIKTGAADAYTGAWNLAPSSVPGVYCPVVMGASSGISRVCDF